MSIPNTEFVRESFALTARTVLGFLVCLLTRLILVPLSSPVMYTSLRQASRWHTRHVGVKTARLQGRNVRSFGFLNLEIYKNHYSQPRPVEQKAGGLLRLRMDGQLVH